MPMQISPRSDDASTSSFRQRSGGVYSRVSFVLFFVTKVGVVPRSVVRKRIARLSANFVERKWARGQQTPYRLGVLAYP